MLLRELLTADGSREPTDVLTATPSLSSEITRVISTALAAQPAGRFADISVMVNDLWAAQTTLPEPAAHPRPVETRVTRHRRPRPRRARVTFGIAAAVGTAGIIAAVVWFALSGAMASRFRVGATEPPVTAVPAALEALPAPPLPIVPVGAPAGRPAVRETTTLRESPPIRDAAAAEVFAHPSAAPRPIPLAEQQERGASPVVDRGAARHVDSGTPAERRTTPDQAVTDGGDGGAIIDWILNRRR